MRKIICFCMLIIIIPILIINIFFVYDKKIITGFINKNHEDKIIRIKKDNDILNMNLEDYLVGVVSSEMPTYFEEEALKAQAVAARTYAIKQMENNKDKEYDVTSDTSSQVFKTDEELKGIWNENYKNNINKIKKAVNNTKYEYITYNGETIYAFFFSTSNGKTEDNKYVFGQELPYLKSVDSSFDKLENQNFQVVKEYSKEEFFDRLSLSNNDNISIDSIIRSDSNRIISLKVNNTEFKGRDFQKRLSLRSNDFSINMDNNKVYITTNGFGHGVGMSQYGANYLAKNNKNYKEILAYYYKDTNINKY